MPKHEGLAEILNDKNTILIYPSPGAVALDTLDPVGINEQKAYNLVLLDGTWPQAKVNHHHGEICKLLMLMAYNLNFQKRYNVPKDNKKCKKFSDFSIFIVIVQAIYHSSPALYFLRACKLIGVPTSEYVIRTQPTEGCLSTLETGASALSILESDPELRKKMLGPLHYLCRQVYKFLLNSYLYKVLSSNKL